MELGIYAQNYVCEDQGNKNLCEIADSLKYCHDLGFTSLAYLTNIKRDDWEDRAFRLREMLDERGVAIHDAHAPFNRFIRDPDDVYREYLRRSIEAASILGVKHMAFHGEPHITAEDEVYDSKAILEETYDFFAPFVDQAKKRNVGFNFENVFENVFDNSLRRKRYIFTADMYEELIPLIEKFNDPNVGCCWDFGHAQVEYRERQFEYFKDIFPYIRMTHVHENYFVRDLHLLPLLFDEMDWKPFVRYMKENNYPGDFTFEFVFGSMTKEVMHEFLVLASMVGKHLLGL